MIFLVVCWIYYNNITFVHTRTDFTSTYSNLIRKSTVQKWLPLSNGPTSRKSPTINIADSPAVFRENLKRDEEILTGGEDFMHPDDKTTRLKPFILYKYNRTMEKIKCQKQIENTLYDDSVNNAKNIVYETVGIVNSDAKSGKNSIRIPWNCKYCNL